MNATPIAPSTIREPRAVANFDCVRLRSQHHNDLLITQSDQESLILEGSPEIVRRVETRVESGTL